LKVARFRATVPRLTEILERHADSEHSLFALSDLRVALPDLSDAALHVLLNRAVEKKLLARVCRGIYPRPRRPASGHYRPAVTPFCSRHLNWLPS